MKLKLHWQIIICMILGTVLGIVFNQYGFSDSYSYNLIILLGIFL